MGWGLPVLHWCFQKPPQPQHCLRGPLRGPLGPSRGWRGSAPGLAQVRQPRPPVTEPRLPGRPALPGTSSPPRRQLNPACAAPEAAAVVRRHGPYRGPAALRPHVPRPRARLSLLRFRLSCPSDVLAAQTWCYISIRKMRPRGPRVPPCPLKLQFRFRLTANSGPGHAARAPRPPAKASARDGTRGGSEEPCGGGLHGPHCGMGRWPEHRQALCSWVWDPWGRSPPGVAPGPAAPSLPPACLQPCRGPGARDAGDWQCSHLSGHPASRP